MSIPNQKWHAGTHSRGTSGAYARSATHISAAHNLTRPTLPDSTDLFANGRTCISYTAKSRQSTPLVSTAGFNRFN